MKLAIAILKYFPHGGLQRDFMRIAEEMHQRGHQVTVYTCSWNGDQPDWMQIRILNPFALTNHGKAKAFFRLLHKELQKDPCDLLLGMCRGPGLDVYFSGDECFALAQEKKHGPLFRKLSGRIRTFSEMERAIFAPESKTQILCLVERQRKDFEACYGTPGTRMHLIPPGMNPDCKRPADAEARRTAFRQEKGIAPDRLVLLCVGANLKLKGADRVIHAVEAMPESLRKKITLLLVGKPVKELEYAAEQVPADIRFEGMSDHILDYYLASDLMVHPARSEAAGSVLIEAIACGLPVICTGLCGFSTYVQESGAGHVLHGEFHQTELNASLEALLLHEDNLTYLSREALEYAGHTDLTGRAAAVADFLEKCKNGID